MTRKEEIRNAAQAYYPSGTNHEEIKVASFIRGARYADKTTIDKTLQWLKAHIKFESIAYSDVWMDVADILATDFTTVDEMEESFRKAMEE